MDTPRIPKAFMVVGAVQVLRSVQRATSISEVVVNCFCLCGNRLTAGLRRSLVQSDLLLDVDIALQ